MSQDDAVERIRRQLAELGIDDLPPEVVAELEAAARDGRSVRVRVPKEATTVRTERVVRPGEVVGTSRRVTRTVTTGADGEPITLIRFTGDYGHERIVSSVDELPEDLRPLVRGGAVEGDDYRREPTSNARSSPGRWPLLLVGAAIGALVAGAVFVVL